MKFSNPRLRAEIADYPIGGSRRGLCVFEIIHKEGKGWKFFRTTTGKPKGDIAYGRAGCIVDGDDGRTYLLQRAGSFNFISVYRSDMKSFPLVGGGAGVFPETSPELFKELDDLIEAAQ